jgi:2-polyprenyl-3-methyl-5-hydroxy-6-metoxy-1,4-benzoquinol methylase
VCASIEEIPGAGRGGESVRLDISTLKESFESAQRGKSSRHSVEDRTEPSILQYDYLTLSTLSADVRALVAELPTPPHGARALDLGCDKSPYRELLERKGYEVRTLDVTLQFGADYEGTAEKTGLPDASFELVLCTQVLEHCQNPWQAMAEIRRILRPGGFAILSAPHVWFYHPHPSDNWRFTQEGMIHLCREHGLLPRTLLAQGGSLLTVFQILNFLAYGALGRTGAPLYALLNSVGRVSDRLVRNPLFSHNFACLAQRPDP